MGSEKKIVLYDIVELIDDLPDENVKMGSIGTVLIIYDYPELHLAYEVEFLDESGDTIGLLTLKSNQVVKVSSASL